MKIEKKLMKEGKRESKRIEEKKLASQVKKIGKGIELVYKQRKKYNDKPNDVFDRFRKKSHFEDVARMPLRKILKNK